MRVSVQQAYVVLGVARDATSDQVRQAYRKLALQFHPDKNPDPSATEKFQQLSAAYKRICDHQSRSSGAGRGGDSDGYEFSDCDGGDLDDLDDLDVSFEEMLTMFEMLFGQATHTRKANNSKKRANVSTKGKLPQVRVPRRGGRGGGSRTGKARGFTNASLFGGGAEEMLFQSFMTMEMAREMSELENDFKSMSNFFGGNFGDSDYSFASDEEDDNDNEGGEDFRAFSNFVKQKPKRFESTDRASPAGAAKQDDPLADSKEAASNSKDATKLPVETKSTQSELPDIELNVQVRVFGKHTGVVKFKGSVHYAKGEFLGVQLSEPLGKNDGRVKGVAYFDCPAQHGLMVRPEDVALVA